MAKKNSKQWVMLGTLILLGFVFDCLTPRGIADWVIYLAPVAMSSRLGPPWTSYAVAAACSVLTGFGFFVSSAGLSIGPAIINRLLAIGAIWLTSVIFRRRHRFEQAIEAREAQLRAFGEAIPDLAFLLNTEGRCIEVLTSSAHLLDRPASLIKGKTVFEIFPAEQAHVFMAAIRATVEHQTSQVFEYTMELPQGKHWFEGRSAPLKGIPADKPMVAFLIRDNTERILMERELREAKEKLEYILRVTHTNIDIIDAEYNLHYVDPGWQEVYGPPSGRKCYEYFMGRDKPCPECGIPSALEMKTVTITEEVLPHEGHRVIEVHTIPFQSPKGEWLVGEFNVDITARKRAESERRELEAQMLETQKLESLGLLAGGIAHDFNNLLVGILGHAELALYKLPGSSPVRENLTKIVAAAQRSAELARQMLAYSGKGQFVVKPFDMRLLIEDMADMLQAGLSKRISLQYIFPENLPMVAADPVQIRQVILSLITNAADAIGDKDGTITVQLGACHCDKGSPAPSNPAEDLAEGEYVFLEVTDSGCGMDEATLSKIFDPFFTTKFIGRGLGLASTRGIVRSLKGTIRVYSEAGKGSSFRILLPTCETSSKESKAMESAGGAWRDTGCILVVDDEHSVLEVAQEALQSSGFSVLTAENGTKAIEIFKRHLGEIRCVILDLSMPMMDGEEIYRELSRIHPDVQVVLASGYNHHELRQRFAGKGLAGFLQKPFTLDNLLQTVRETLAGPEKGG